MLIFVKTNYTMALDNSKVNDILGEEIHQYLLEQGVETPMLVSSTEDKVAAITFHFDEIMMALGLNMRDDSLMETPKRVAKMYVREIFWGLDYKNFPKITVIENKMKYSSMVIERKIAVKSVCEHHFLPFIGYAYIAYIPNGKVVGLSKLNRVVEFFSRRPQVQERLVEQIYAALSYLLETPDVAVLIKAEHFCVKLRGAEDAETDTITTRLGGVFYTGEARSEFLQVIND